MENNPQDRLDAVSGESAKALDAIMCANHLKYLMPPKLNCVSERRWSEHLSTGRSEYTSGNVIELVLNNGTQFLDARATALVFDVEITGAANAIFGNSVIDMIKSVRIMTADGTIVVEEDHVNHRAAALQPYLWSDETAASMMGVGVNNPADLTGATHWRLNTVLTPNILQAGKAGYKFVLPLWTIIGLFDTDELLPSHLVMGMKLQFTLEPNKEKALIWSAAPLATDRVFVRDPRIITLGSTLADGVLRQITKNSSGRGLSHVFHSYEAVSGNNLTSKIIVDSKRQLARCVDVFAVRIPSAVVATTNSFLSAQFNATAWNYVFAGQSLPALGSLSADVNISYYQAMAGLSKAGDFRTQTSVSLAEFDATRAIYYTSLERSGLVALSGRSVSVGSQLSFQATFGDTTPSDVYVFLRYVAVADSWLDRTAIKL